MAEFKSRYTGLSFYVDGSVRSFKNGRFVTEDKNEIEALEKLSDAVRLDEPSPIKETKKAEEPAAKAPAKKASDK